MLRSVFALIALLHALIASAADCGNTLQARDASGESSWRSGCLIDAGEVNGWNSYAGSIGSLSGTVSTHSSTLSSYGTTINSQSSTITAQAAQIAALQAAVTALQEGGTGPELPMIFDITEQQGVEIALAILALWAVAWIFRTIISVVKQDEKD